MTRNLKPYAIYDKIFLSNAAAEVVVPLDPVLRPDSTDILLSPGQPSEVEDIIIEAIGAIEQDHVFDTGEADGAESGGEENEQSARQVLNQLAGLLHQLHSIRPLPKTDDYINIDEPMNKTGADWELDSWYKDIRQPPLAARLETVVKFLAEEDVDRCMDWEVKFAVLVAYLEWLANQDQMHQLQQASPFTQGMFNDAVSKAKVHVLFQKHHYDPTPVEISKPSKKPLKSTRLNWTYQNRFAEQEKEWWHPINRKKLKQIPEDAENDAERNNLAYIESETFDSSIRDGNLGWVCQDPATGYISLNNGQALPSGDVHSWAIERGARPTVGYRKRLKQMKQMREFARLRVEDGFQHDRRWVTLPRNIVNGGPFVWRGVDPNTQAHQDLLRQCLTAVKVLEAANERVPRPLLVAVLDMAARAEAGGFDLHGVPQDLKLANGEWEKFGEETVPKFLDLEEVPWLKFLAGECVNSKNWKGHFLPDTPKEQYKLFLIFARRVQKLLEEKDSEGLFSRHNNEVTVEELLEAINGAKDGSAVTKCEFQPYDACSWLDRMKATGHVKFRLDLACYGVVQRPSVEFFPEHRVIWPGKEDTRERPNYHLGYIANWSKVIQDGQAPDGEYAQLARRAQPTPTERLQESIEKWERACITHQGADKEPTRQELAAIRAQIIDEVSANETMLAPGRHHTYFDRKGQLHTVLLHDHNWDWASLAARGQTQRRQFWSINRWPIGTGYLSEATERAIKEDANVDPEMTYDPAVRDPVNRQYMRLKLKPYRQEKVLYRPGPAIYPVGDTKLQRDMVEKRMTEMVCEAAGLDRDPSTWGETLAEFNPFSRPSSRAENPEQDKNLPPVNLKSVPKSWDPQTEAA
ncbi:hypothetical protein N0V88_003944 [Collariella sp. IMI 366227]|nr:hypothetical protein N0V88_003944 [Collariella sp. IMI 366227]